MKTSNLHTTTIAISAALLFGCSADNTNNTTAISHPQSREILVDKVEKEDAGEVKSEGAYNIYTGLRSESDEVTLSNKASGARVQTKESVSEPKVNRIKSTMGLSTDMVRSNQIPTSPIPMHSEYSEPPKDNERYIAFANNPIKSTAVDPLSTFGVDVDTASYTLFRQTLNQGSLPRAASVRTEEWTNYFTYDYPTPTGLDTPFSINTEIGPAPWNKDKHLLAIGLKGYDVPKAEIPPLNLCFLIDVSGSMSSPNKLGLAKNALKMLTRELRPEDRVAIVVYAGAAGIVLESTPGDKKQAIIDSLDRLRSGGSTAGGAGIQLAYKTAKAHHQQDSISRVILLSDGDFNVGTTNTESLKELVANERVSGVSLTVLTFGRGNISDALMSSLAKTGNGNAGYIDTAQEAKRYLVDEMAGSMMTIANDVKAQIEFNPNVVSEHRLLGYETRHLEHNQFKDDKIDSGDIGAGHQVTALYELVLNDSPAKLTPDLRYQSSTKDSKQLVDLNSDQKEIAFLKLRYKKPTESKSVLVTHPIYVDSIKPTIASTSDTFRWAASVAGAAQHARGTGHVNGWSYGDSVALGKGATGRDTDGYRQEFIRLMELAHGLDQPVVTRYSAE